jgi:hypothetical protein
MPTDRVRLVDETEVVGERAAVDLDRPAFLEPDGDDLRRHLRGGVPVSDTHDRLHDVHRGSEQFEFLGLVGGAPQVGVRRIGLLLARPVREVPHDEELAHLGAPAEFADEDRVEPGLVDPELRIDE